MATSVTTSTTPSTTSLAGANAAAAASVKAANKANAQKIITSLGTGSGVDVASLAQNLTDAERVPKQNAINAKISKNESRISGYAAISYVVSQVQTALNDLNDQRDYTGAVASVDTPNLVSATAGANASEGSHELTVTQMARAQRAVFGSTGSAGFADATTAIVGLSASSLTLSYTNAGVSGTQTIAATNPTDIVKEINGNAPTTGVKAQLVYTGSDYKIVLMGNKPGTANSFSLAESGSSTVAEDTSAKVLAKDAQFSVDGVSYTRSGNTVSDVLPGVTLAFKALSSKDATGAFVPSNIDLTLDKSTMVTKVNALLTAYNDAISMLNVVSDPKSTVDTYGATLVGDSMVSTVRAQLRTLLFGTSDAAAKGSKVTSIRDLGLGIDVKGNMTLDAKKLDDTLSNHFDEMVTAMTGNFNDLGEYSTAPAGIAGDASRNLTKLLKATGDIETRVTNAKTQNSKYQDDLANLQTRMDALLARYQKQFAAMDSMVGSNNALKASLKSTFDGMSKSNNN